jgi:SAM-dependent methyltransferase
MKESDRRDCIERYEGRLREHGYSPEALGWGKHGRQEIRFGVLAAQALAAPGCSVLDVGCGFADLHGFLVERGWRGRYTGIDIVPGLLDVARERHPGLDLRALDITGSEPLPGPHDFAIASGIFNARLASGGNMEQIEKALERMSEYARVAVCVDFLSTHVDFEKPDAWHTDPAWALGAAARLSRRLALRHDYMPYEFALFIYRDDSISSRNTFSGHQGER